MRSRLIVSSSVWLFQIHDSIMSLNQWKKMFVANKSFFTVPLPNCNDSKHLPQSLVVHTTDMTNEFRKLAYIWPTMNIGRKCKNTLTYIHSDGSSAIKHR